MQIHSAALAMHLIGEGLALAEGLDPKHAIKQVERLLSNPAISVNAFFARWVPFVVAERQALRVALEQLHMLLKPDVRVTLLADHGSAIRPDTNTLTVSGSASLFAS